MKVSVFDGVMDKCDKAPTAQWAWAITADDVVVIEGWWI